MNELYFRLVTLKLRTCNKENLSVKQVPDENFEEVMTLLAIRGYSPDGDILSDNL